MPSSSILPNVLKRPSAAPRRRSLTIVFSDLSDSTRLAGMLEAEDYLDLLGRVREIYHDIVERHGGTVAQISGDGMLALFGYPETREGDARRAVEAALDLHAAVEGLGGSPLPALRLHSGIHAGLVLLQDGDLCRGRFELLGSATNLASRLCASAAPGEILVSEATLGPDRRLFATGSRRRLRLRGTDETVATLAVTGRGGPRRGEASPFVGRAAELDALQAHRAAAHEGARRFVAIEGPPGVGKTRLAEELLANGLASGARVHRGECDASAAPLQPFLQIARSILAESKDAAAARLDAIDPTLAQGDTKGAAAALCALIGRAAARGPLILFIDDWHLADDASRDVAALLAAADGGGLLLLATARPDAQPDARLGGFERLGLAPFGGEDARAAVRRLLAVPDPYTIEEICSASGGNALFIEELCHARAATGGDARVDSGTPWLAALIESRFTRLAPEQAQLARVAAIVGTTIPCWLLEALTGHGEDDPLVASLAGQDFIYPGERPGTLRFKHGITREAIYESVGLHERRALHRRIAEALRSKARDAGEDEPVEALAYHYGAAAMDEITVDYAEAAGDKALGASALDRAQKHYRAALDALWRLPETGGDPARVDRIAQRFGLACVFDPSRDQLPVFQRVAERAAARRDRIGYAWAEYWLGYIRYGIGEPAAAIDHCTRALEAAAGSGDERLVVHIRATLGQAKAAACDYRGALLLLDEAIEVKRRHRAGAHPSVGFAYWLGSKAFVLGDMGRFAEAEAYFDEAMEVIGGAPHEVEGSVLCQRAAVALWQGRIEDAARFAARAESVAVRVHSVYLHAMSRAIGAYARWSRDADRAHIDALLEATGWLEAKGRGLFGSLTYGWLADALARSGDARGARRYALRALRRARVGDRLGEAMALRAMARVTAGSAQRAGRCLDRAAAAAAERESAHEIATTQLCAAELAVGGGDAARAATLLADLPARFEAMEMPRAAIATRALQTRLAAA